MRLGRLLLGLLPGLCHGLYDAEHRIESARIYGNIEAFAYYFVDLLVGTPPQRVSVILDTGSGVVAFPCASCTHCGKHIDPAFDFAKSSTAAWANCDRSCSGRCDRGKCTYYQGYTEGSAISGFWFKDYVRLGDAIQHNPAVMGRMGCHQNENNLFYTQKANGILGIGPVARGGGRTLLQELFQDKAHVHPSIFSICLAEWGGRLVVGGYNASYHTGSIQYVPLTVSTGYYGVSVSAMKVDGQVVSSRFGRTMIDSGTTFTYMGTRSFRGLRDAINSYCGKKACGATKSTKKKDCWDLPSGSDGPTDFPHVEVLFGSVSTRWVAKAYMGRKGKTDTWCYTFKDDGFNANTVLGASWMIHQEIIFDMRTSRVGIVNANCPEFHKRPEHPANLSPADLAPPNVTAMVVAPATLKAAPGRTSLRPTSRPTSPRPSNSSNMSGRQTNSSNMSRTSTTSRAPARTPNTSAKTASAAASTTKKPAVDAGRPAGTVVGTPKPAVANATAAARTTSKPTSPPATAGAAAKPEPSPDSAATAHEQPAPSSGQPVAAPPAPAGPSPGLKPPTTSQPPPPKAAPPAGSSGGSSEGAPSASPATGAAAQPEPSPAAKPPADERPATSSSKPAAAGRVPSPEPLPAKPSKAYPPKAKPPAKPPAKPLPAGSSDGNSEDGLSWLPNDAVRLSVAGLGALLTLGLCVRFAGRSLCRKEHRHVQLKETDDSGMPPQIVGAETGNGVAGPDTFVIGDDDDECEALFEDANFSFDFSAEHRPARPSPASSPSPPRASLSPRPRDNNVEASPARTAAAGDHAVVGPPVFAGPAEATSALMGGD